MSCERPHDGRVVPTRRGALIHRCRPAEPRVASPGAIRGAAMHGHDQLTALDAAFLELEQADDGALMHIGAALVFDPRPGGGAPAIGEVREHLGQRLELLPRYRQRLGAPRTGGLAWPSWERDQRFELDAHVRHATLPSPGD